MGTIQPLKLVTNEAKITVARQCELLGVNRSSYYYEPKKPSEVDIEFEEHVCHRLDYWHTQFCYFGVRRLVAILFKEDGIKVGRKLVKGLMEKIGIKAIYPKQNLSKRNMQHKIYPYLLRNLNIFMSNQVWAVDITYIKMGKSHMYLTAIIDWHSRFIVGWELSETLETEPVLVALQRAIEKHGVPGIINSDQGSQFTSDDYTKYLKSLKIRQSMDGKARWVDNVLIERWFRSLKCEDIYITEYKTPKELNMGISSYVEAYNYKRPHQSLEYSYPAEIYTLFCA